jgi:hypothetical protein
MSDLSNESEKTISDHGPANTHRSVLGSRLSTSPVKQFSRVHMISNAHPKVARSDVLASGSVAATVAGHEVVTQCTGAEEQ